MIQMPYRYSTSWSYHITSYHFISYHIISLHISSYHIISLHIIPSSWSPLSTQRRRQGMTRLPPLIWFPPPPSPAPPPPPMKGTSTFREHPRSSRECSKAPQVAFCWSALRSPTWVIIKRGGVVVRGVVIRRGGVVEGIGKGACLKRGSSQGVSRGGVVLLERPLITQLCYN